VYSSATNLNIAAIVIIGIFKHLFTDLMRRLITNEISNLLHLEWPWYLVRGTRYQVLRYQYQFKMLLYAYTG
jgi:hypothetical protein